MGYTEEGSQCLHQKGASLAGDPLALWETISTLWSLETYYNCGEPRY